MATLPGLTVCMSGHRPGPCYMYSRGPRTNSDMYYLGITSILVNIQWYFEFPWRKSLWSNSYMTRIYNLHVGTYTGTVWHAFPRTSEQFRHVLPLYYLYLSEYSVIFWVSLREICREQYLHGADWQSACRDIDRDRVTCIPADLGAIPTCITLGLPPF